MTERKKTITEMISTDIVVLNDTEKLFVEIFFNRLSGKNETACLEIGKKLMDLERMSAAISRFPSIHETSVLAGEQRSQQTLIDNLCKTPPDSRMLSMPTKAVLGRGFVVAKFHTFSALTKIASKSAFSEEEVEQLRVVTLDIMFTIMAEDVYISILDSNILNTDKRAKAAEALTYLWEHRLDKNTTAFAPVLTRVWTARDKIAPVFGTMMGTSELFLLSAELGESWQRFMTEKLANEAIGQAMEEFIFGISYEDILFVRKELIRRGVLSVDRSGVAAMLNKKFDFSNTDPRLFYSSYVQRRNNADARKRLNAEGPKNTLEDYYIAFLFENDLKLKDSKSAYETEGDSRHSSFF
ncbi:hypothetical protein [Treponema pedis]|uniref:hypothetical protein n=1 Tax=Treponema pedis TaxID=409322 RepID=UPI003133E9F7